MLGCSRMLSKEKQWDFYDAHHGDTVSLHVAKTLERLGLQFNVAPQEFLIPKLISHSLQQFFKKVLIFIFS